MAQPKQRLTNRDRRRRRRGRAVSMVLFVLATFGLAWFFESQATTTIILVRHADTDLPASTVVVPGDAGGADGAGEARAADNAGQTADPPLNERGRARAELLADFLQDIDVIASVDAIYATDSLRTRQTAMPLAGRLGLDVTVTDHYDYVGFMAEVLREHKGRIALVVTNGDALAPLVEELHGSKNVPEIGPSDYDNLYIVTVPWFAKVKTLRIRYALGWDRQFELHAPRQRIPE